MNPTITAFAQSPDRGRGLARDMAVRWALEEVGQPYDVRLLSFAAMKEPAHRVLQPFGQIPTYEDGTLALFESAAIVLHVAEAHSELLPNDANARARAIAWMFAAKSTVEPPIIERSMASLFEADRPWHAERLRMLDVRVRVRLSDLSRCLAGRDWLEQEFSAADVIMVTVLRRLGGSGLLEEQPTIAKYVAHGEARPAFRRAFEAQRAVFAAAAT
jgi:glutathione S-transferase